MASHQMRKTTQLAPLLGERDIEVARIADRLQLMISQDAAGCIPRTQSTVSLWPGRSEGPVGKTVGAEGLLGSRQAEMNFPLVNPDFGHGRI